MLKSASASWLRAGLPEHRAAHVVGLRIVRVALDDRGSATRCWPATPRTDCPRPRGLGDAVAVHRAVPHTDSAMAASSRAGARHAGGSRRYACGSMRGALSHHPKGRGQGCDRIAVHPLRPAYAVHPMNAAKVRPFESGPLTKSTARAAFRGRPRPSSRIEGQRSASEAATTTATEARAAAKPAAAATRAATAAARPRPPRSPRTADHLGFIGIRPSRCVRLRASLRARRTASASSRAFFFEGFRSGRGASSRGKCPRAASFS